MTSQPWEPIDLGCTFPFRHLCQRCANEQPHHHVGPKTRGMMRVLDRQTCKTHWQRDRTHHHHGDTMTDRTESEILRSLLWLNHSRHHNLYGEGGFLWCNVCQVDFRTTDAEEIERRFTQLANEIRPPGESDLQTQSGLTLAEQIKIERDKLRKNLDRALTDYDTVAHQRQYLQARIEELESLLERVRSERDQIKEDVDKILASSPRDIIAQGWDVALHNESTTESHWLFTRGRRAVWGVGTTSAEALNEVRTQLNPVVAHQSDVASESLR